MSLSALIVVHNEEATLEDCIASVRFADEILVVLDKCTDGSKAIAERLGCRLIEGAWEIEGDRRNAGIEACTGAWILEIDADERVSAELAAEISAAISTEAGDWIKIPFKNYVGNRFVRYGWGASFGVSQKACLFRKSAKRWGRERVHPSLIFSGQPGLPLTQCMVHHIDRNISDMVLRLDRYSTARAPDLRETGNIGSLRHNVMRFFGRFYKCYFRRKGYREGVLGLMIAVFAGLYPLLSYAKAHIDEKAGGSVS
jgi:glycosyltransferase involved in cell wall biosynthesis